MEDSLIQKNIDTSAKCVNVLNKLLTLGVQLFEKKPEKHSILDLQQQCEHCCCECCISDNTECIGVVGAIYLKDVIEYNGSNASASTNEAIHSAHALRISKWDNG